MGTEVSALSVAEGALNSAFRAQGLELIHADASLVLVNKPSGLLAVPGRDACRKDCVARRVESIVPDALVVHRLDMETSGLMVLARGKAAHRTLSMAFQNRAVSKRYIAIVDGLLEPSCGEIDFPLIADWPNRPRQMIDFDRGKPSLTRYRVLAGNPVSSRVELMPVTGRSHQLRVHLQALGHPILGDALYAPEETQAKAERLLLHAELLAFHHPVDGRLLSFFSPSPF